MKKILLGITCLVVAFNSFAQPIMSQNFLGSAVPALPTGWTSTLTAITGSPALGWQTTNTPTSMQVTTVPNTSPHTVYAVVNESADTGNNPACLISPAFSLSGSANPYLSYDFFFQGGYYYATTPITIQQGWTDISTDGGTTWTLLDSISYNATAAWTTHLVNLSAYNTYTNCKLRFNFRDNGRAWFGLAISNVLVFNELANDAGMLSVAPAAGTNADYVMTGSSVNFTGTIRNFATTAISSFSISYQVGTSAVVTTPIFASVPSLSTYNFTCSSFTGTTAGTFPVKIWVNAPGDSYLSNDTMSTSISVVNTWPTKKVLFEEATGTWCGFCVRGIVYMDSIAKLHGDGVSLVAVHNGDPMVVSSYDSWIGPQIGGYPDVVYDRQVVADPDQILVKYNQMHNNFGFADIHMIPSVAGSTLTLPVTINPAVNMTSGDYRLVFVLTEDSVHNASTPSTWDQHNYYNGGGYGVLNIDMPNGYNFVTLSNPVPATMMYYNHVNRYVDNITGNTTILPGSMTAGTAYTHTYSHTLTGTWVTNRMHAIVILIDGTSGNVLNTQNVSLSPTVEITNVNMGVQNLNLYPNPANDATNVQFVLNNNSKVQIEVLDMVGKTVYTIPSQEMSAGSKIVSLPTSTLASGVYNVRVQTGTSVATERLTIVK